MEKTEFNYFYPLCCIDDLSPDDAYVSFLLHETEKYNNIRNIAIIGPYGSGKSSVAHTFIRLKDKKYKHTLFFSQDTLSKYIKNTKNVSEDIKAGIYLELLKYDTKSLLMEKYIKSITSNEFYLLLVKIILWCLVGVSTTVCFLLLSFFTTLCSIFVWLVSVCFFLLSSLIVLSFKVKYLKMIVKGNRSEFSTELENNDDTTKILEEVKKHPSSTENLLLYILKKNKIKYIVIEDMERLLDSETNTAEFEENIVINIIKEFKQLSDLISRSKIVKRNVVFVYGLNERCFNDSEKRSKYFDLILPVIPIANYTSASQALMDSELIKTLFLNGQLKHSTIDKLSLFFSNQRQINAFTSQFYLHYKKKESELSNPNELFAITALITLFPRFSHCLFEQNNDLDKLLNNDWAIDEKGHCSFAKTKEMVFPKIVNDDHDLSKFLKICIGGGLITKSYRFSMSLHKLADDKLFDFHDLELLKSFYSGIDIRNELFNFPGAVLNRDTFSDFFTTKDTVHPQLFEEMVRINDDAHLSQFNALVQKLSEEDKKEIYSLILNKTDKITLEYLISYYKTDVSFFNCISGLDPKIKYLYAFDLFRACDSKYFLLNIKQLSGFIPLLHNINFYKENVDSFEPSDFEKLRTCGITSLKDVSLFSSREEIIKYFKLNLVYELSINNISTLFPLFKEKPFNVLNNNPALFSGLSHEEFESLVNKCAENQDDGADIMEYVKNNSLANTKCFIESKKLKNKKYSLMINDKSEALAIGEAKLKYLLEENMLDLNMAYKNFYISNPATFNSYLSTLGDDYLTNQSLVLDENISTYILKCFSIDFVNKVKNKLTYSSDKNNYNDIESTILVSVYSLLHDDIKKDIAKLIFTKNKDEFESALKKDIFSCDNLMLIQLPLSSVVIIADSNKTKYYDLLISEINKSSFEQYLSTNPENKDFARFVFTEDGALRKSSSRTLALICRQSLDNTGCLSKVMKDASDEQLSDNEWAHFIEEYVKKYGGTKGNGFYYLDSRIDLNALVLKRFSDLRRIAIKRDARSYSQKFKIVTNLLF